jgi:site-specific DNA-methyltransferase (adenine-specific)
MSLDKNKLYYGDNLQVLREYIPDASVDLIYLDPPFNSRQDYNVLFAEKDGSRSASQITAFKDTWEWNEEAARAYEEVIEQGGRVADAMRAFRTLLGGSDMLAYLAMMAPRLVELRRVLKETGSIYLHCDPTASHYLKLLMDGVFGPAMFRCEVIWKRTTSHGNVSTNYGNVTDSILFYAKSDRPIWNQPYAAYSQDYIDATFRYTDENGRRYTSENLRNPGVRPNLTYDYKGFKPHSNGWAVSKEKMEKYESEGRLLFPSKPDGRIRLKRFLDEQSGAKRHSLGREMGFA